MSSAESGTRLNRPASPRRTTGAGSGTNRGSVAGRKAVGSGSGTNRGSVGGSPPRPQSPRSSQANQRGSCSQGGLKRTNSQSTMQKPAGGR
eukprot:4882313-Prymnesium_polylepis.1